MTERQRCVNCDQPIRPVETGDGLNIDGDGWNWIHVSGDLFCYNGYYDEENDQWHDSTYASVGGDGWG